MKIVGYSDRLSVHPGEKIRFMVSSELPTYRADIVRLIHGDENPKGPGVKEQIIETVANRSYKGRKQILSKGSHMIVSDNPKMRVLKSMTLQAWVYPTTPRKGNQGILTKYDASDKTGYGLFINERGELAIEVGKLNQNEVVSSGEEMRASSWYFVAGTYDANDGKVSLHQQPLDKWPMDTSDAVVKTSIQSDMVGETDSSFVIGGYSQSAESGEKIVVGHFNGKIDSPSIFSRALSHEEIERVETESASNGIDDSLLARWDFGQEVASATVLDVSGNGMNGMTVNMPKRAVTGHNWTGKEHNFRQARNEYAAVYFHDDDLEDACWQVDFELTVSSEMKSGVYAVRLRSGDSEDYVPFFVTPTCGRPTAKIALLMPTLSYLAYGNEHVMSYPDLHDSLGLSGKYPKSHQDKFIVEQGLLSLYDRHTDGSGVCYASRLRPILNMRPKYNAAFLGNDGRGSPHQFNADLNIVDWLEVKGFDFDVITDEDLHFVGYNLLASYKVLITGSHPEYWTFQMLTALDEYTKKGGRVMYLGGNGIYWVTSIDPERVHNIEVRRWGGGGTWESPPGEYYHSTTGEFGGKWRTRGMAPQKFLGVGFTAQGFDRGRPYRRELGSLDPRASFIFEGIGPNELIGNFESLALGFGAAGDELDRVDYTLGTPHHALVLATATGFSDSYQHAIEENLVSDSKQGGTANPFVKAEMVFFECPNKGAVFSVGSISWRGCLSYNGYNNNISRITENVLRKFAESPGALPAIFN